MGKNSKFSYKGLGTGAPAPVANLGDDGTNRSLVVGITNNDPKTLILAPQDGANIGSPIKKKFYIGGGNTPHVGFNQTGGINNLKKLQQMEYVGTEDIVKKVVPVSNPLEWMKNNWKILVAIVVIKKLIF